MNIKSLFKKLATALPIVLGGVQGCATTSSTPMLYETNAIPDSSLPQVCRDYNTLVNKGPNWQSIVQSGVIGVATSKAANIFSGLDQDNKDALGGVAALGDILLERRRYNEAVSSYRKACNVNTKAILNGQLCQTTSSENASASTHNGNTSDYKGRINTGRNCTGVEQTNPAPGLSNR